MATVSFMNSTETGYGSMNESYGSKSHYATNSMSSNMKNPLFR